MADFLAQYSIQRWLESCAQGYLTDTVYGHQPGESEPTLLFDDEAQLEAAIRTTVQLVVGERCALAASSGLVNAAPDYESKRFLATQTLDEARHVEIFTQRLYDLGVKHDDLESTINRFANPNLIRFAEVLLDKVNKGDFIAGVVGQNIVLEGMAFSVFEMMEAGNRDFNPKFAHTLSGTIADERRHVGFGENRIGSLIREHPEKKDEIEKMQEEMTFYMLAVFADTFSQLPPPPSVPEAERLPEVEWHGVNLGQASSDEMESLLSRTVIGEYKTRLNRIGLEYRQPKTPV